MWLFLPVSFTQSIDETPRPSIEFWFHFLIGWQPRHPSPHPHPPRLIALVWPPPISLLSHIKTQKEKVKKSLQAVEFYFFQSPGREGRSGLTIWRQSKRVKSQSLPFATDDDLPGLNSQLDALVKRHLLGHRPNVQIDRECLSFSCRTNDAGTADDSCADIQNSSSLSSMHKDQRPEGMIKSQQSVNVMCSLPFSFRVRRWIGKDCFFFKSYLLTC